jgi:hypothetical protein
VNARRRYPATRNVQLHLYGEARSKEHSLRPILKMVDEILKEMSPQFAKLYSDVGCRWLTTKFMVMLAHSLRATRSEILGPDG